MGVNEVKSISDWLGLMGDAAPNAGVQAGDRRATVCDLKNRIRVANCSTKRCTVN